MEKPHKRTKNTEYSIIIPMDIVNEILQRLPAKSVAKLVRVSKSWATIIRSNCFINSFSSRQLEFQTQQEPRHHRLLFTCGETKAKNWSFSSCTTHDNQKSSVEFISRMVSQVNGRSGTPIYVNGLLNFMFGNKTQVISNPSTGKSIVLPIVKFKRKILTRYFGFDPINGEYKVLCIVEPKYRGRNRIEYYQNQVLTVDGSTSVWREVDSWIPHRPLEESKGICIDGILYYLAYDDRIRFEELILVRFDVRSEKFLNQLPCEFVKPLGTFLKVIKYESKLGIVHKTDLNSTFDLWVLEDVNNKLEWLKISGYSNPCIGSSMLSEIKILGITKSKEIMYTCYGHDGNGNFCVIYHDYEKDQQRIVEIKDGRNGQNNYRVDGFVDYVESVMLL